MNKRYILKQDLAWLALYADGHMRIFKRMYSHENMNASISNIVDGLSTKQLDWAIIQVHNSLNDIHKT